MGMIGAWAIDLLSAVLSFVGVSMKAWGFTWTTPTFLAISGFQCRFLTSDPRRVPIKSAQLISHCWDSGKWPRMKNTTEHWGPLSVFQISGILAQMLTDLSVINILKQSLFSPVFLVLPGRKAYNLLMYNKLIHR